MNQVNSLKAKLVARALTHQQYMQLRNSVRILRCGVRLDAEQNEKVKEFEDIVAAYEKWKREQGYSA